MAEENTTETEVVVQRPSRVEQVVYLVVSLIEVLLVFRLVLRLFGASTSAGFVEFIYTVSAPLVAPFFGIFQADFSYGQGKFELATVVAMVVYLLAGYLVLALVDRMRSRT